MLTFNFFGFKGPILISCWHLSAARLVVQTMDNINLLKVKIKNFIQNWRESIAGEIYNFIF